MKAELVFTRRFCMGHRLISGASEMCALPHGHNEFVTVTLRPTHPARLDGAGNMMVPFAQAKSEWHRFVDNSLDHALQLSDTDPLLGWFRAHEPTRAARILVTPGDPTTEMTAALLLAKLGAFLKAQGNILYAHAIALEETPTNTVRLSGDPTDYLPNLPGDAERFWWNRADMSVSDSVPYRDLISP